MDANRQQEVESRVTGGGDAVAGAFPLRRVELLLIVAFWALLALVTIANRLFDPRGGGPLLTLSSAPVALALVDSLLWALLTPPLFWVAGRVQTERGSRVTAALTFAAAALAAAVLVNVVMGVFRATAFPPPPRPHRPPRSVFDLGRFWILNDLIVAMGILAAGLARAYSLRYRARQQQTAELAAQAARLEAQLAEARLEALRRQLDPHFLFNTLHAISSLVERDPRGVRRMISRLSELLRHSIEGSAEQEIPLERELALLGRYLDIMQIRFQGRLEATLDVDDAVRDALVPNLVLQPIVENAIKHGTSRLVDAPGRLVIAARREGDDVVLAVRDNGPGAAAAADGTKEEGSGLGLRNTRERLAQLYGAGALLELRAAAGGGTLAEIRLPYHTQADLRAAAVTA